MWLELSTAGVAASLLGGSSECGILWAKARTSFQLLQEASEEFKFRRRDL